MRFSPFRSGAVALFERVLEQLLGRHEVVRNLGLADVPVVLAPTVPQPSDEHQDAGGGNADIQNPVQIHCRAISKTNGLLRKYTLFSPQSFGYAAVTVRTRLVSCPADIRRFRLRATRYLMSPGHAHGELHSRSPTMTL